MHSGSITHNNSSVHFHYGGQGATPLVCFHGYSETCAHFNFLEKYVGDKFKIIAIDLPFHGETEWKEKYVHPSDLAAVVKKILEQLSVEGDQMYLMGFSLGGRMALCVLQELPSKVSKLVLLAPDGLKVNFWYWLATQTYIGNRLFGFTMKHPAWFFSLLQAGNRLKLINQSVLKFTRYYIHDITVRRQLYERWTCMRAIKPNLASVKKHIRAHRLPVRLLYGQYDRIIRHERGEKFRTGIESFCTLHIIQTGHQVLQEKQVNHIIQLIQS